MLVYILFIAGFVLIILGADFLVNGASSVGSRLKIPPMVIGLTVVAMGTSLPELVINVFAAAAGETDLAISNVLGSNIMNILLITGIAAIIFPINIQPGTTRRDIPISAFSVFMLALLANDIFFFSAGENVLSHTDGYIFIILFIGFLIFSFYYTKSDFEDIDAPSADKPALKSILLISAGLVMLFLGGRWIINGTVAVAGLLKLTNSEVGLVIVATATSLPELATSVVAAIRKKPSIAIGNAIGSCIFNIFLVLGVTATILPLPFHHESNQDLLIVALSNVLLLVFVFTGPGKKIQRLEGIVMVVLYVTYMVYRLS